MKWRTKSFIKQSLFCLIVLMMSFPAVAQGISDELSKFSEIKTFNAVEVVVIPSENNRIEITGHSKEKVKYSIVEGRLEIRLSLDNIWSKDNTLIKVYGRSIETIDANEGSFVRVSDVLKGDQLVLRVQEGAHIVTEVDASRLTSKAISGGRIDVDGKAVKQEVEVNSGGQYFAQKLRTKETTVSSSTAGKAEIYATDYCKATAKLGGVIEIFGNPDEVDQKTSLGGKIL